MAPPLDQSPLRGLSVVITRPTSQSDFLYQRITELGAKPILFPCIEIVQLQCRRAIEALPINLDDIDMFIFVSRNAVQFSFAQIPRLAELPSQQKIFAAVGTATAITLRENGVSQVLTPQHDFDSEALLALPELNALKNKTVLIIKGALGRTQLFDTLITRGAQVYTLDVYERQPPINSDFAKLEDPIDVILFTSSESVENMLQLVPTHLHEHLLQSQTITGHDRIATKVTSLGFEKLPIIATNPSDAEMLAALLKWAHKTENDNDNKGRDGSQ